MQNNFAAIEVGYCIGGIGRFNDGLRCKGGVKCVIIDAITEVFIDVVMLLHASIFKCM